MQNVDLEVPREAQTLKVSEKPGDKLRAMPAEGGRVRCGGVAVTTSSSMNTVTTTVGVVCADEAGEAMIIEITSGPTTDTAVAGNVDAAVGGTLTERLTLALDGIESRYNREQHARLTRADESTTAEHAEWLATRGRERALIDKAGYDAYAASNDLSPDEATKHAAAARAETAKNMDTTTTEEPPNGSSKRRAQLRDIEHLVHQALAVVRTAREAAAAIPRPSIGLTDGILQEIRTLAAMRLTTARSLEVLDGQIERALEASRGTATAAVDTP